MVTITNPFLLGNFAPGRRGGHRRPTSRSSARCRPSSPAATCATARTRTRMPDGAVPLVPRRRHGARRRAPRRRGPWYRNRWVRSAQIARALGEPQPVRARRRRCTTRATPTSSATPAASGAHRRRAALRALARARHPRRRDFGGPLPTGYTAHPKLDPRDRRAARRSPTPGPSRPQLPRDRRDRPARAQRADRGRAARSMVHDLALTAAHVVFFDLPVVFDLDVACSGLRFPYRWDDDYARARRRHAPRRRRRRRRVVRRRARATCSTRSTRTTTATRSSSTSCRHPTMFAHEHRRARTTAPADARALDDRPGGRQGPRGAPRRPRPGVPRVDERCSVSRTATATRSARSTTRRPRSTATARAQARPVDRARPRCTTSAPGRARASSCSCRPTARRRRGRRLAHGLRLRPATRRERPRDPRRPRLRRPTRSPRCTSRTRAVRLPRQLDPPISPDISISG